MFNTCFLFYQYELNGRVADSMLVNTILMLVYVTKFFWWEAGYWNTMDIAHDRGSHMLYLSSLVPLFGSNGRWDVSMSYF